MSSTPRSVSNASPSNTEGLEKFFRRFFVKSAQVVIQSRQSDKVCTRSNGHPSSNEWFSLNINVSYCFNLHDNRYFTIHITSFQIFK